MDRLGQADVCNRLSALGLRRPEAGLQDAAHRGAESQDLPGQRKGVLRFAMSRQVVARKAEVAPGSCKIVTARGRQIGLFAIGGEYFGLSARCPHKGAVPWHDRRLGAVERTWRISLGSSRRVHPLSVARLGVRHPYGAVLV